MTLRRPNLGNVMYMIHRLLLHLAVTFKHWERNFNKFKNLLGVVIWWQHSSNRSDVSHWLCPWEPLLGISVGFPGWCWSTFQQPALLQSEGRYRAACLAEGPFWCPIERSCLAVLRVKPLVLSAGHGQLHQRRDQLSLAVIGSHSCQVQKESLLFINGERNSTF